MLTLLRQRLANRLDSEHEQATLRVVIVALVLAYMAIFHGWAHDWAESDVGIVAILVGFLAIAVGIFVAICVSPAPNVPRRLVGMVSDVTGCTWYMSVAGEYGFFVIGIFLFITFGNGFRYGRRYLFGCQLLSLAGLIGVLLFVPFWEERRIAGIGLLIALVVLPLYVSTLIKRMQEAKARAEEANVAKTTFLANMSHEIRTPLNGIVGVVDLFDTTALSPQQEELVALLRHSVAVLRSLVDDVLDISKIESGRVTIDVSGFDLYAAINSLVALLKPHARSKGLDLVASVDPQIDYRVRGDPHHLRQVLLNLIGNAIKFTERGEVTLAVALKNRTPGAITVHFEVRDTGIGIPPESVPRIFERFVQADQSATRRFGGSGLGTTIAKQLVELMGGNIGVDSTLGKGTVFWFDLPFLQEPPGAGSGETPLVPAAHAGAIVVADERQAAAIVPKVEASGTRVRLLPPHEASGQRLAGLFAGAPVSAVIASCDVDVACAAFASASQLAGEQPIAFIYVAREPLSVVDSARLKSIRQTQIVSLPLEPRFVENAIHAVSARGGGDLAEVVPLSQLVKRERIRLNVLVADDNATNRAIVSQLLTSAGHNVVHAADGEEALDAFEARAPDIALLDFNMPGRNGLEVVRAMRVMEPEGTRTPTIILSASVTPEVRAQALDAGADEFVGKPFEAVALLQTVDAFARALQQRKARPSGNGSREREATTILQFPARAAAAADGVLDHARLVELEDISRNSRFMTDLLKGFKDDISELTARLDRAVAEGRRLEVGDLLHALKGAAVGVGALRLAQACDLAPAETWVDDPVSRANLQALHEATSQTMLALDDYVLRQHKLSL